MSTVGLFDSALAIEVRSEFERRMRAGESSYAAAAQILAERSHRVHDPDDGQAIIFALAELQLDCGALTPQIRKRALTLINSGEALERWEHLGAEIVALRRAVEQRLRERLVAAG